MNSIPHNKDHSGVQEIFDGLGYWGLDIILF